MKFTKEIFKDGAILSDELNKQCERHRPDNVSISDGVFDIALGKQNGDNMYRHRLCIKYLVCPICGRDLFKVLDNEYGCGRHKWIICPVHGAVDEEYHM